MAQISIIIPVYNAESYLQTCLQSILSQTYTDYEVVMIDDGSRDRSAEICLSYTRQDNRFRLIQQANAGPGAARNRGLNEACCEYICFVDADDWMDTDYLSTIMSKQYDGIDVLFWGYSEEKSSGTTVRIPQTHTEGASLYETILQLKQACMFGYSVCSRFKRQLISEHRLQFFTDIRVHEDLCFINQYCQYIGSIGVLSYAGYHYRIVESGSLSNRFYPSDECLRIAQYLKQTTIHWWRPDSCLAEFEIGSYLSKLNLSVMNMFDARELAVKSLSAKLARIRLVKHEVKQYYGMYPSLRKTSHKVYRYLPTCFVWFYQLLFRYIR